MQRQRGELVPIGEVVADLDGPVQALIPSPPTQRHFTRADQVNQLVTASETTPDLGFHGVVAGAVLVHPSRSATAHLAAPVRPVRGEPGQSQRQVHRPQLPYKVPPRAKEDQDRLAGVELRDGQRGLDPASLDPGYRSGWTSTANKLISPFLARQRPVSGLSAQGWTLNHANRRGIAARPQIAYFPQACVILGSFPRLFGITPRPASSTIRDHSRLGSSNLHYLAAELAFTPGKGSKPPFCGRGSPREGPDGRLDSLPAGIDWRERPPPGGRAAAHLLAHQLSLLEAAAGGPEGGSLPP